MTSYMNQYTNQMAQILAIRDKFVEISKQSDERLTSMIESAKSFRTGMEPLRKEVDQLQTRVKNLQDCMEGLSHVQNFYKTGREVEQLIIQGPTGSLTEYLKAMDRIKDSLVYFNQNNTEHLEFTRLSTLLANGLKALSKYFGDILSQSFSPMPPELLYKLAEKDDTISLEGAPSQSSEDVAALPAVLECESISEDAVLKLQEISSWLRKATALVSGAADTPASQRSGGVRPHLARLFNAVRVGGGGAGGPASSQGASGVGGIQIPQSLAQYCDFRKDLMHVSLIKLREYQKSLEKNAQTTQRPRAAATGKRRGLKAAGVVWDANLGRQVVSDVRDVDDLDSEHYATSLSAFLILIEREKTLLDRLKLAANSHEAHFAYSLISRSCLADLTSEGGAYLRLMSRVVGRGEFYMIVSLLTVMRRFVDLSPTFVETLKMVSSLSQPMVDLVSRFRVQIKVTLDVFLQQLQSGTGSTQVPPDATVHELTTNVLLFLEKLLEFEVVVGTVLTWDEVRVSPDVIFPYLTTINSKPKMARSAFGQYIVRVTTALVANIDKKSVNYSDDLSRIVFQMNNLRYILTNLNGTGLEKILSEYDVSAMQKFAQILNESKTVYTRAISDVIGLSAINKERGGGGGILRRLGHFPNTRTPTLDRDVSPGSSTSTLSELSSGKLDSRERFQLKDIWSGINQGLTTLLKQHSQLSIPDKELRDELRASMSNDLAGVYQSFYDRSLQIPFTSRRDKYIKLTPPEFKARLDQIFMPGGGKS